MLRRSGARSSYYIDKYLFTTRPDLLARIADELAARVPAGVQRLAGPVLGGILTLVLARRIQASCDRELRRWYEGHHGRNVAE